MLYVQRSSTCSAAERRVLVFGASCACSCQRPDRTAIAVWVARIARCNTNADRQAKLKHVRASSLEDRPSGKAPCCVCEGHPRRVLVFGASCACSCQRPDRTAIAVGCSHCMVQHEGPNHCGYACPMYAWNVGKPPHQKKHHHPKKEHYTPIKIAPQPDGVQGQT